MTLPDAPRTSVPSGPRPLPGGVLTARQRQILLLVVNGHTTAEIARRVGLGAATVTVHVQALRDILGARNRPHLGALALALGYLTEEEVDGVPAGARRLRPRQEEVLVLIATGHTTASAARQLGLSEGTVSTHLWAVSCTLDARSRAHLGMLALALGYVTADQVVATIDDRAAALRDRAPGAACTPARSARHPDRSANNACLKTTSAPDSAPAEQARRVTTTAARLADLKTATPGTYLGASTWRQITQDDIDEFAAVTGDRLWLHTSPNRAADGPFGTTIAHGFLTLSLIVPMWREIFTIREPALTINYGLDSVRFPAPVPAGAWIRTHALLADIEDLPTGLRLSIELRVEREGHPERPVCAAVMLLHCRPTATEPPGQRRRKG